MVALEGGYNLNSISVSAEAVIRTLLGKVSEEEVKRIFEEAGEPMESALTGLKELAGCLSPHWKKAEAFYNTYSS